MVVLKHPESSLGPGARIPQKVLKGIDRNHNRRKKCRRKPTVFSSAKRDQHHSPAPNEGKTHPAYPPHKDSFRNPVHLMGRMKRATNVVYCAPLTRLTRIRVACIRRLPPDGLWDHADVSQSWKLGRLVSYRGGVQPFRCELLIPTAESVSGQRCSSRR